MVFLFLNACSPPNNRAGKELDYAKPKTIVRNLRVATELTPEQQSAFDALNRIQVSTDEMNRLYSTFAGTVQPCGSPDSSITISQSALLVALKQFVTSNCKYLTDEERDELTATAVLAQEEYTISLCQGDSVSLTYENGPPMTGTWVMPSILGRRDVVIVW